MRRANLSVFVPHAGCLNRCSFCNQHTISGAQYPPSPGEVSSLCRRTVAHWREDGICGEIAFFGGSFTAIERSVMVSLLDAASPFVDGRIVTGIRISTRPDCVDEDILLTLAEFGVTAVELGVQSMDDTVLARNRRGHTRGDVERASHLIRQAGMELGHQIMPGLLGDTTRTVRDTARRSAALSPDTVRIYPTLVLRGTELEWAFRAGEYRPLTLEETVELCAGLLDIYEDAGIRVLRLGLHDSGEVKEQCVAGPYHPALRDLCESRRIFRQVREELLPKGPGQYSLWVHPKAVSRTIGNRKENLAAFEREGFVLSVRADAALEERAWRLGHP